MFTVNNKDKSRSVYVHVSPEDIDDVMIHKWYTSEPYMNRDGCCKVYIRTSINRRLVNLHHFIYARMVPNFTGLPAGYVIDHIDNNPCNNCRSNLRMVSLSLNSHNVVKRILLRRQPAHIEVLESQEARGVQSMQISI